MAWGPGQGRPEWLPSTPNGGQRRVKRVPVYPKALTARGSKSGRVRGNSLMASSFLIVRVAGRMWALALRSVVETLRIPRLSEEGGAGVPALMGTAVARGELCAVLDLGVLLGFGEGGARSRAVLTRLASGCVLLAVDEVLGVRSLEADALTTLALPGGIEQRTGRFDIGFAQLVEAGGLVDEASLRTALEGHL